MIGADSINGYSVDWVRTLFSTHGTPKHLAQKSLIAFCDLPTNLVWRVLGTRIVFGFTLDLLDFAGCCDTGMD